MAAQIIRNILVDHARGQLRAKRGGGVRPLTLDRNLSVSKEQAPELVALDDALNSLATLYPQQAKIVELRYFGGLTKKEISQLLEISVSSVDREWRVARAWLYRSLTEENDGRSPA